MRHTAILRNIVSFPLAERVREPSRARSVAQLPKQRQRRERSSAKSVEGHYGPSTDSTIVVADAMAGNDTVFGYSSNHDRFVLISSA
jgi:hypothetical protein